MTRTGEEILKDFEDKMLQLRRNHQRRLFWFDIFLCALVVVVIAITVGVIYLFKLK